MNWCETGAWVHRHRGMSYRFVACQDLLGDWVITQFWNSLDQGSGRRSTLVYDSVEALQDGLSLLLARRLHDGPAARRSFASEDRVVATVASFDNRGA